MLVATRLLRHQRVTTACGCHRSGYGRGACQEILYQINTPVSARPTGSGGQQTYIVTKRLIHFFWTAREMLTCSLQILEHLNTRFKCILQFTCSMLRF